MKNAFIIVLSLAVVAGLAILFLKVNKKNIVFQTLQIGASTIKVEIADTEDKREKGLSGREKMGADEGMLFVFAKSGKYYFWMKEMRFPLDFVYLNNNEIVEIKENISQMNVIPFTSSVPADAILEVNASFVRSHNIRVGDLVSY